MKRSYTALDISRQNNQIYLQGMICHQQCCCMYSWSIALCTLFTPEISIPVINNGISKVTVNNFLFIFHRVSNSIMIRSPCFAHNISNQSVFRPSTFNPNIMPQQWLTSNRFNELIPTRDVTRLPFRCMSVRCISDVCQMYFRCMSVRCISDVCMSDVCMSKW